MKNLVRFIRLYRPLWFGSGLGIFLALVTLAANIGLMGVSGWFIATMAIAGVAGVSINYFTPAVIIRGLSILRTAGRYAERLASHDAALRVTAAFRNWFYGRLEHLPHKAVQALHSGDIWSRLKGDIDALERFYLGFVVPACVVLIGAPFMLVCLWLFFPSLIILHIGAFTLLGIVLPVAAYRMSHAAHTALAEEMKNLRIAVTDYVQGMDQIMTYDISGAIQSALDAHVRRIQAIQSRLVLNDTIIQALAMLIVQAVILVSVAYSVTLVAQGQLVPALLAALPLLLVAGFDMVLPLINAVPGFSAAEKSAGRIFAFADQADDGTPGLKVPENPECISFEKVKFEYEQGKPVLNAFSLKFSRGDQLCIWGPSGAGKTSIISLMTGLWPVNEGRIVLNGVDLNSYDLASVRHLFGVSEQRPFFFAGTIRDNLLRARPDATDEDMMDACDVACLQADILSMPAGLDTDIGERGFSLSGGQMRRLAIARAWLKNTPFLLLDEPSEGLEADLAQRMTRTIQQRARSMNKGLLVVSHSPEIRSMFERQVFMGNIIR